MCTCVSVMKGKELLIQNIITKKYAMWFPSNKNNAVLFMSVTLHPALFSLNLIKIIALTMPPYKDHMQSTQHVLYVQFIQSNECSGCTDG